MDCKVCTSSQQEGTGSQGVAPALQHNRVCRGRSRFGGVAVTGYKTSLKANDAPFGVSAAKEGGVAEFASGGRYAVGCW